ncbi:MAG TPA: hypothetical protein VHU89_16165 [Acidobacteriaceae bacterium]|jgi:hypothetical protein|nr:hypothetical protein [Acidobacteriaceae bacterium]
MATFTASNPHLAAASSPANPLAVRLLPLFLTPLALLIHGYHPFAGDAGIYGAGIRHILHPALYPRNAVFVTAFARRSIFPWLLAALVRVTRLPLPWILLATHLLSLWLFLFAAARLAERLFSSRAARIFATVLAAACCALPVAGTALALMDPYVTARSFSTPLSLLAVSATLDRRWLRVLLLVALTIAIHPLMGAYTLAFVLLLALVAFDRPRTALLLCAAAFLLAGTAFTLAHGAPVDPACRQAVSLAPRSFLFLARWRWYEVLGLLLPLALFALSLRRLGSRTPTGALCLASLLLGSTALLIAACFVPTSGPFLLVPFQVLRSFHLIYGVGIVLCGGFLATWVFPICPRFADEGKAESLPPLRSYWLPAAVVVLLFAGMFQVERLEWPGGRRLELPGVAPANPYTQAFLWIRAHTPPGAVFAFNPRLVYRPGEDEQGFRALSERDQLADDKDAGVAAVVPALAPRWAAQRNAELSVDRMSDAERLANLPPLGATWLLLPPGASTSLPCPYRNAAVQVCRLSR